MEILFKINDKEILDTDTTILHTSKYNYNNDIVEFLHHNAEVITKNKTSNVNDLSLRVLDELDLLDLINKDKLTKTDIITMNILNSLESVKDVIVFYDVLTYVDSKIKKYIIKKLKEQEKRIINYTGEIEETLLLDYLIITHQNKVIMEGNTKVVLLEEKIIKKLGFNLPCVVELSNGLKHYNVVKRIYFNEERLVEDLWK